MPGQDSKKQTWNFIPSIVDCGGWRSLTGFFFKKLKKICADYVVDRTI
jgi:hypothetical protein